MRRRVARAGVRDEAGQMTVMIIGFFLVVSGVIAVAVDSTAAYVQRQRLDTLADGAALRAADLAASGSEVYTDGVPEEGRLLLTPAQARAGVAAYLAQVGARDRHPGLSWSVEVDATTVLVRLSAPLDLPLDVPGAPVSAVVGSTGSAAVDPEP